MDFRAPGRSDHAFGNAAGQPIPTICSTPPRASTGCISSARRRNGRPRLPRRSKAIRMWRCRSGLSSPHRCWSSPASLVAAITFMGGRRSAKPWGRPPGSRSTAGHMRPTMMPSACRGAAPRPASTRSRLPAPTWALPLDEITLANRRTAEQVVYKVASGTKGPRATSAGHLRETAHASVLVLSTGEKSLCAIHWPEPAGGRTQAVGRCAGRGSAWQRIRNNSAEQIHIEGRRLFDAMKRQHGAVGSGLAAPPGRAGPG